ncbi:pyridoxine 5'-phosphate synthase [Nonlabens arenilitoris]|uniref:Pyridoxine 5'-phosphate synthase n=1 Tax=Nonlabens arenilitoris TaxID=1217969 RepID=A0A2S7U8K2_9FLAO|nr:pyridoxine 5'-phosphate synthase [Nonlabens arenilitoris]PQJ31275.1 pyridoxine 5'-phosphate synthase [Nonlabens arenilitoris]
MTALSVNVNKIATLRNARGGNVPDLIKCSLDIERFGAQGITIHPRPDERHIRYQDARDLKKVIQTELNIEGNPNEKFIALVDEVQPAQVTLVPDAVDAITSDAGWDTIKNEAYLTKIVKHFKDQGIRTSIFVDPSIEMVEGAAKTGVDRIELYTEAYAHQYPSDKQAAVAPYIKAAQKALDLGLGINAGHDLSLENMRYFKDNVPGLLEVSIGHALISESLYMGLENVVNMYKSRLTD